MNFTNILYEDLNNKKLHLGINTYNKGFTYVGESLLVKPAHNDALIKEQTPVGIKNIKVIDRTTKKVIDNIIYNQSNLDVGQVCDDSKNDG